MLILFPQLVYLQILFLLLNLQINYSFYQIEIQLFFLEHLLFLKHQSSILIHFIQILIS